MTGVSEKFRRAMKEAAGQRARGKGLARSLSLCIEGPAMSGKTYIAREHLDALAKRGLIDGKKIQHFYHGDLDNTRRGGTAELDRALARARGGAIIVDDISPMRSPEGETANRRLMDRLIDAISSGDCVVILIGSPEGLACYREDHAVMNRMCDYIILTPEAETALPHPIKALSPLRFVKPTARK